MSAANVPLAIQWHDGMLLSPQHFQEADRRTELMLAHHLSHVSPYHYGIVSLKVAEGTLVSGLFRVEQIEAIMPDGTLAYHEAGRGKPDLSIDLRPHAAEARGAPLTVFLAMPPAYLGGPRSSADMPRHQSATAGEIHDEQTGEDPLEIPRMAPSIHLRLSTEPRSGRICLPIAQVKLEGEAFVSKDYVPPLLGVTRATTSDPSPIYDISQRISARLRQKASRLAEKANNLSRSTDREIIAELRQQVYWLIAALPAFEAVLQSERPHPFQLFTMLTGVVGQLASLAKKPDETLLHAYNHEDLRETFVKTRDLIFRIVDEGIKETFTAYAFDLREGRYSVLFQPEFRAQQLAIGVRVRGGVRGEKEVQQQLSKWIDEALIGSAGRLRTIQQERVRGATRIAIQNLGPDIVATEGVCLYKLDEQSKYFDPGEVLTIVNTGDPLATQGPTEIILYVKPS
jgi:type VI secretion system protein ImpJ